MVYRVLLPSNINYEGMRDHKLEVFIKNIYNALLSLKAELEK